MFSILLWAGYHVSAQQLVQKSIEDPFISNIHINASQFFEITFETADTGKIVVKAVIEGEYGKDQVLQLTRYGGTLEVSSGFRPNFVVPGDKLSAHKVIAIALKVQLPKGKNVNIYGTNTNVFISGNYKHVQVIVDDGNCSLDQVQGEVEVTTRSGNITVYGSNNEIEAFSRYGSISGKSGLSGENHYKLTTVTGNIEMNKTE